MLEFIKKIREYLAIASKILFVGISSYYIIQYNAYKVSLSFLPNILLQYTFFAKINSFFENMGLALLVLPLTIVLVSFIYTESKLLKIASTMLSVGGNVFTLGLSISKGHFEDFYKFAFIKVYNSYSFENKVEIFRLALEGHIRNIPDLTMEKLTYIQSQINIKFASYSEIIKTTPMKDLTLYASKVSNDLNLMYIKYLSTLSTPTSAGGGWFFSNISYGKIIWFAVGSAAIFGIGWGIKKLFWSDNAHVEHAKLSQDITKEVKSTNQLNKNIIEGQINTDTHIGTLAEHHLQFASSIDVMRNESLTQEQRIAELEKAVNHNANILKQIKDKLNSSPIVDDVQHNFDQFVTSNAHQQETLEAKIASLSTSSNPAPAESSEVGILKRKINRCVTEIKALKEMVTEIRADNQRITEQFNAIRKEQTELTQEVCFDKLSTSELQAISEAGKLLKDHPQTRMEGLPEVLPQKYIFKDSPGHPFRGSTTNFLDDNHT